MTIDGEWHVLGTTFPMWKKGDKLHPRFRYTAVSEGVWRDEVLYDKRNGLTGRILGKDYLKGTEPHRFLWRGAGLLFFVTSKWQIDNVSADGDIMLISFQKTLFTPAGADLISRRQKLTEAEKREWFLHFQQRFAGQMDADWAWIW